MGGGALLSDAVTTAPEPQLGGLRETWEIVVEGQRGVAKDTIE